MNAKPEFSNKTQMYILRVILAGALALMIGMAGAGQTLQAAAESLAQTGTGSPLVGDVRIAPDLKPVSAQDASGSNAPGYYDTSVFMTGSVAIGVILPESSGGTENWTPSKVASVKTQIQNGMAWWSDQYAALGGPGSLSFTYEWHTPYDGSAPVAVSVEPINNSSAKDYQWANEILGGWGYTQSYTQASDPDTNGLYTMYLRSLAYANDLRAQKGTDWAFTIFVVDSENDLDGRFTDGYFAYAYLYGPMMVMTYDNDGWGIGNMYRVAAHETGHIFGAGDQYYQEGYGGCTSKTQKYGYLGIANSNCDYPSATGILSIMKSNSLVLDATARNQIGWRDSDADGIFDPLDTPPSFALADYAPDPTTNTNLAYSGTTYVQPWPHAACGASDWCYDRDVTTQKLAVDYSVDGGAWQGASAADGSFESDYEGFNFEAGTLPPGTHDILARSRTSQGGLTATWSDTVTIQSPALPATPATNDDFPGTTVPALPFADLDVDTTGATSETVTDPPDGTFVDPTSIFWGDCNSNQGQASVWYNFTPTENVNVYVDTIGSDYDTLLAVWKGSPENLTLVACNDDISSVPPFDKTSKTGFFAQGGTTYYIEVIEWTQIVSSEDPQSFGGILNFHMEQGNFSVIDVHIGDPVTPVGVYILESGDYLLEKYAELGAVEIRSDNGAKIVATYRQLRSNKEMVGYTGISQVMGLPAENLTDKYVLPYYNGADATFHQAVQVANFDTIETYVTVAIGEDVWEYHLLPGENISETYPISGGPIVVESDNGAKIIASLNELKKPTPDGRWVGQSQILGMPFNKLSDAYLFPRYNGLGDNLDATLIFAVP